MYFNHKKGMCRWQNAYLFQSRWTS